MRDLHSPRTHMKSRRRNAAYILAARRGRTAMKASEHYRTVALPRLNTTKAAITWLRGNDPEVVASLIAGLSFHERWKAAPLALADHMETHMYSEAIGHRFGAWKGAQLILQAAGLPYMPDAYEPRDSDAP